MTLTSLYMLVCFSVFIVLGLITYVYFSVYRIPQEKSIERLLSKLYAGPSDDHDRSDGDTSDTVVRRDKILRMRDRLGAGIDSLPTVRFSSTASAKRVGADNDDDDDDDEAKDNEQREMRARQRECLTVGVYLYPEDDYVDCRSYCGVTDGVDYHFYERAALILNGRKGRVGAYCVPNDAAACNSNTSLVLYTKDGWRCMPQTRAFSGEGGNLITVCNGTLLDRATGRIWRNHIDPTLTFESIDERLPNDDGGNDDNDADGNYRFVCPSGVTDEIGNALIPAPFDRLLLIRNVCASLIPYADTKMIRPNFRSGLCECGNGDLATLDRSMGVCVPYSTDGSTFRRDTLETALNSNNGVNLADSVHPCIETWSSPSMLDQITPDSGDDWREFGMFPCGIERGGGDDEDGSGGVTRSSPACVRTYAQVYDRVVPSPYAMLEASESIKKL